MNCVTKFSRLVLPLPPVRVASQVPFAVVLTTLLLLVLVPQPQTASSSASTATKASFFTNRPQIEITTEDREMRAAASMDVRPGGPRLIFEKVRRT